MTVSTQWWPTVACIFCLARTTIVVQAVFYLHIAQFLITVTYTGVVNFCTLRYLTLLAHCIFVSCLKFCLTTAICLPRFLQTALGLGVRAVSGSLLSFERMQRTGHHSAWQNLSNIVWWVRGKEGWLPKMLLVFGGNLASH